MSGEKGGLGRGGQPEGGTELEAGYSRVASGRGLGLGGVGASPGATKLFSTPPPTCREPCRTKVSRVSLGTLQGAVGIFDSFSPFCFVFFLVLF